MILLMRNFPCLSFCLAHFHFALVMYLTMEMEIGGTHCPNEFQEMDHKKHRMTDEER